MTVLTKSLKTELYRKAVHLSSLWIPFFIWQAERWVSIFFFLWLFIGNLVLEYGAYKKVPVIGSAFRRMFFKTLRHKEVVNGRFIPSGSVYVLLSALVCSFCFSRETATAAMAVMLVSDACAALVGKFWGRIRYGNGKSLEGTTAFAVSAFLLLSFLLPEYSGLVIMIAAMAATAAEFFEEKIMLDDNFSIPLVSGMILNLFHYQGFLNV